MKNIKLILTMLAMLFCTICAQAQQYRVNRQLVCIEGGNFIQLYPTSNQNYMYLNNLYLPQGVTKEVEVYLHSTMPIWMLQLYLQLPEGITVSQVRYSDAFYELTNYSEGGNTYNENSLTWSMVGQELRIVSMNMTRQYAIPTCTSGKSVFTIRLKASSSIALGTYSITTNSFKFVAATTTDGEGYIGANKSSTVNIVQPVTDITLNKTSTSIYVGSSETLIATISPSDAYTKTLSWSSSNTSVATVDQNGKITALKVGTTTIRANATDGSNISASCMVTVRQLATGISLNKSEVVLLPEMTQNLYVSLTPSGVDYSVVSWSSSNTSVAKVTSTSSSNGSATITAVAPGTAKIYARTTDGSGLSAICQVTVVPQWCFLRADTIHYVRGTSNTVVELPIELVNYVTISGLQFDLQLGTNMAFNLRNGMPDIWLEDSRKARNHTVAAERQSETSEYYRVLVSSQTSLPLKGTSGVLIHANMQINKYGTAGLFPIWYSNITMAAPDETQFTQSSWSSYLSYEYVVGDANADTHVNVGDFGVTANKILGREVNSLYFSDAANVNQDGIVNVTDLVGIANISLGIRPQEIRRTPSMHNAQCTMHNQASLLVNATGNQMSIALDNAMAVAGVQMDIALPQGVSIQEARLQGRAAGHDLQMATLPDGRVRLLVASFSNHDIAAGDDAILTLTLDGDVDGIASITDIVAAERDLTSHELEEVSVELGTTGIHGMATYNEVRIYTQDGNIVIESPATGIAQLVMLNGITRELKVTAGRNVIPMESGCYIVRFLGKTAKLKL